MTPACGNAQAGAFSGCVYEALPGKASRFSPLMASPAQFDTLSSLYHQSVRSQELAKAENLARLAFQASAYRSEAHLWQGLTQYRSGQLATAFLHIAKALELQPEQPSLHALLVRCLQQQGLFTQALGTLEAALTRFPTDGQLRNAQVPLWIALHQANLLSPSALQWRLQQALPDIANPSELKQTLDALRAHVLVLHHDAPTDKSNAVGNESLVGVVWHDPVLQQVTGWVIDLSQPERPLEIEVEVEFIHQAQTVRTRFKAHFANPLLQAAYGITHGGFRVQLPMAIDALTVRCAEGPSLIGSPVAALPVFAPPDKTSPPKKISYKQLPVDILVPVYKGREATLECIDSVIRHAARNRTKYNLIVLDDASPDDVLVAALQKRARQGKLRYLRHPANLGFIRNMNRGMALHPEHDVVWLNADTRVHGDWLDRLRSAAYSAEDIASVTPWSNNGELMSFPHMRHAAPMPDAQTHAALDETVRHLGLAPVRLETGCGFCMYIKRRAIEAIGYLDEVHLKRGYGEETDWCLRAQSKGWRNVGAVNVFVAHAGGHSFGPEKALRVFQNNTVLRQRYPAAERNFKRYLADDPLAAARHMFMTALLASEASAPVSANIQATIDWLKSVGTSTSRPSALTSASQENFAENTAKPEQPDISVLNKPLLRIADTLNQPESAQVAQRWIQVARHLARLRHVKPSVPWLLLTADSPWEVELLATGQVIKQPMVEGLTRQEVWVACGCPSTLSLAKEITLDLLTQLMNQAALACKPGTTTADPRPIATS